MLKYISSVGQMKTKAFTSSHIPSFLLWLSPIWLKERWPLKNKKKKNQIYRIEATFYSIDMRTFIKFSTLLFDMP